MPAAIGYRIRNVFFAAVRMHNLTVQMGLAWGMGERTSVPSSLLQEEGQTIISIAAAYCSAGSSQSRRWIGKERRTPEWRFLC
jgi:hypothetical protein